MPRACSVRAGQRAPRRRIRLRASGIGNDAEYEGAVELQNLLLGESDVVRNCVAKQWFTYANGRAIEPADTCQVEAIQRDVC